MSLAKHRRGGGEGKGDENVHSWMGGGNNFCTSEGGGIMLLRSLTVIYEIIAIIFFSQVSDFFLRLILALCRILFAVLSPRERGRGDETRLQIPSETRVTGGGIALPYRGPPLTDVRYMQILSFFSLFFSLNQWGKMYLCCSLYPKNLASILVVILTPVFLLIVR